MSDLLTQIGQHPRMRLHFFLAAGAIAAVATFAQAEAPIAGEQGIARPGGVYTTVRISDAMQCAQLCTRDSICMAWTQLSNGVCELKAVTPTPVAQNGAISGLSPRAPDFARRVMITAADPAPVEAPETHVPHQAHTDADTQLLGAADDDGLRPGFGAPN